MNDFSNIIFRWTFSETKECPTSLQAFDMLECSILFIQHLFPNAKRFIVYNSLKSTRTLERLKIISNSCQAELLEAKSNWDNTKKMILERQQHNILKVGIQMNFTKKKEFYIKKKA